MRAAEDVAKEADARLLRTQAAQSEAAVALARTERKVALLAKERDGLKSILASYDEEEGDAGAIHHLHNLAFFPCRIVLHCTVGMMR